MVKGLLFAMRHGETLWNAEGRFQGSSDFSLTDAGERQASENGKKLRAHFEYLGVEPTRITAYASPLKRTRETISAIAREVGIPESQINIDARLAEASSCLPAERRLRKVDRWNFNAHGGESYADLAHSMKSFLADLDPARPVLLVSHAGNIRVMAAMLAGVTREEAMTLSVPHDAVFRWDGSQLAWI